MLVKSVEPPNLTPSKTSVYKPNYSEKYPAKALFKATRKGKNKLVSIVFDPEVTPKEKEGFVKPSQQQ